MLEKKHLVFLAGATAPFAPPLCTALRAIIPDALPLRTFENQDPRDGKT